MTIKDYKELYAWLVGEIELALTHGNPHLAFYDLGKAVQNTHEMAFRFEEKKEPELLNEASAKKWAPIQNRNDEHMRDWEPLQRGENHWPVDGGNDRIA